MKIIYIGLIMINILGFFLIGYDKLKAKKKGWRIPEKNLFVIALLGGAAGVFLGMKAFRHKTKHYSFMVGIPLIFGLNILVLYLVTNLVTKQF